MVGLTTMDCELRLEMTPGILLDALVAVEIMGWQRIGSRITPSNHAFLRDPISGYTTAKPKPYCSDISAAWEVVEKMRESLNGHDWFTFKNANRRNAATFSTGANYEPIDFSYGQTAPHAICLAALKAVGVNIDD